MEKIDIGRPLEGVFRERFFARSVGTSFDVKAASTGTVIDLYDEIGWYGVNAKDFRKALKESSGDITLRVNSGGGSVFDGLAIYNDLIAYDGKVRVEVTGLAASIASIIAMAGDEIVLAPNAMMMIHEAWSVAIGNRHDFTDAAELLAKIDDAMARTYAARTKSGIKQIKQWMQDETWMTAKEAVEYGFATSVAEGAIDAGTKAKFDLSVFAQAPESLRWSDADNGVETEEDIEKLIMRDAGKSRSQARALIRDIRAGTTSKPETKPGAGGVELSNIAAALKEAHAAFHNIRN